MTEPLLTIRNLEAWYGESKALHGMDFDVQPGELVTLIGRNGAGKSTTLRSIMGIVGKRSGSIRFDGQELIAWRTFQIARTGIAILMVEQNAKQALNIADKGYVLVQGRNRYTDTGEALLADPEVRRAFLGG